VVDAIFLNGRLLTQDPEHPLAEALAIEGGRVVAVGRSEDVEPLAGAGAKRVDLEGGALLPGFHDAHVHVWKVGQLLGGILDLRSIASLDELKEILRRRDRELPEGTWLLGRGYNEARMKEGRQPTRRDLDQAVAGRPVALTRTCGHMIAANSRAIELAGVDRNTTPPSGGAVVRDESGEPTGLFQETAMGLLKAVMTEPTPGEYAEMVLAANEAQLAKGITGASEAGATGNLLDAYRALERERKLRRFLHVMAMRISDEDGSVLPLPERQVSDVLRIDAVKLFADGGLSGATAALKSSYRHESGRGVERLSEEEIFTLALDAQKAGLRVCTHAIGDLAIDHVLAAYERLHRLDSAPREEGRGHRLEHFGLPDAGQIARAARIGAIAAPQTIFLHALGANFRRYLTEDYLSRTYPIRSMLRGGITVALGSDAPVVPDDHPLLGIQAAVTRRDLEGETIAPEEAITAEEALYAYTMGGALACGEGTRRGSLTAGKWADFVQLERSPLDCPAEEIASIGVVRTFVRGEVVFSA
jgi:predicted amidohydrolase YtcJ